MVESELSAADNSDPNKWKDWTTVGRVLFNAAIPPEMGHVNTMMGKKELAELDSQYAAKIAGREIALNGEIARAAADFEKEESLRDQLVNERKKLQAELEEKKEQIRHMAK